METKRKRYTFRQGEIIDVEEFHNGSYGAPGEKREKREKPTKEQMQKVNAMQKAKRCRQRLLEYFTPGDCFATLTYEPRNRPPNMDTAKEHFRKFIRQIRAEYKKQNYEVFWIRNIERGTKGAWHIHLVINEIGDTASMIRRAWPHGGVYLSEIRLNDKIYDEDFTKLANYMTKDKNTRYQKADGSEAKPRIKEASYSISRNMPLPEPRVDHLLHWRKEPLAKKGYYIVNLVEGSNPVTGYSYRRYTMMRLHKGGDTDAVRDHKHRRKRQ